MYCAFYLKKIYNCTYSTDHISAHITVRNVTHAEERFTLKTNAIPEKTVSCAHNKSYSSVPTTNF